jgi:thioredoxin reductase (NADPH)
MELSEEELRWAGETIKKTGLFTTCSDDEMRQLLSGLAKKHYHTGQTILFQGEISNCLSLVESGLVSIWIRKGKEKNKVAELGPNSFFGEISLLTPRAATATVKAENDTEIVFLPGEIVQAIIAHNPVLSEIIHKKIDERLQSQEKTTESK